MSGLPVSRYGSAQSAHQAAGLRRIFHQALNAVAVTVALLKAHGKPGFKSAKPGERRPSKFDKDSGTTRRKSENKIVIVAI
jgi:hypothetical protein